MSLPLQTATDSWV